MDSNHLINRYLEFYKSLDSGKRKPETKEQLRFVKVCRGKSLPKTEHEIAYMNYKKKILAKSNKSNKRHKGTKPKELTKEQLRLIKSNHNYKPRTPLEIQEFRNRIIENEESIRKKDFERNIDAMQFDSSNKKCKRCGASMVWRERKSISPTKYFWGCSRYPRCKYVESGSW